MKELLRLSLCLLLLLGASACSSDDDEGGTDPTGEPSADLSLFLSVDENNPLAGDTVTYTLTLCNAGPDATTGVVVEAMLPNGVTYESHSGDGSFSEATGVWDVGEVTAAAGCASPATLDIVVTVDAGVAEGTTITLAAEVIASGVRDPDSTPDNASGNEDDADNVSLTTDSSGGGVIDEGGFVGAFALSNWTDTGILGGTTTIEHPTGTTAVAAFGYDVSLTGGGVSQRTASYTVVAPFTGTISYDYEYTGFHAFFAADLTFVAGSPVHDIAQFDGDDVRGTFTFTGSHTINVVIGQPFTFELGGSNFDSNSNLRGTLTVSNLEVAPGAAAGFYTDWSPSSWSDTGITGGTTAITPASGTSDEIAFSYDVSFASGGVSQRTATFSIAPPSTGTVTFDWEYTGFHAFFSAEAELTVTGSGGPILAVEPQTTSGSFSFSGTATVDVASGGALSFEAGGNNFDSNSQLNGVVTLRNFRFAP